MSKVSIIKDTNDPRDSHLASQLVGCLGPLVGRCNHGWEAPLALLLFTVFCIALLKDHRGMRTSLVLNENSRNTMTSETLDSSPS